MGMNHIICSKYSDDKFIISFFFVAICHENFTFVKKKKQSKNMNSLFHFSSRLLQITTNQKHITFNAIPAYFVSSNLLSHKYQ